MKTLTTITISLLLLAIIAATPAATEPASVLLQEGLYAEEIKGDLDAAIKIYEKIVAQAEKAEPAAAQATFRIGMCLLKKGDKAGAAEYFQQVVSNYPTQKILAKNATEQLKKVKPETKKSVFEQIDYQVTRFLGDQFGKIALEAGQKHLLVNSHIYYVDPNGFRYQGGMNAFYNRTGRTITQKVGFGGTSYPNQTLYGVDGRELNAEIVPDKTRANHWQIYWIPDEPLAPEEHLYYGWSRNDKQKLPQLPGGAYSLTMQNKYGSPVIETFFLVLPKELKISQSNTPTGGEELLNFDVYWWTKTVQQSENHVEQVTLAKEETQYAFGPVIEKIINDDGVGENFMFDLDTGKSFSVSDAKKWSEAQDVEPEKSLEDFVMKSGVDLFGETSKKSLMGIDMIAMPTHNERWDMSPEDVIEQIYRGKAGSLIPLSADGELPKTFVFKTGQGGMGILQITEMQAGKSPRHFKIRYKILQKQSAGWQHNKYHIVDDTALDIDRGIIIGVNKDVPREYDIGWDNDNGGVLMVNPKKSAQIIGLSGIGKGKNKEAIERAEKSRELLENSPSKGILAEQTVFCAVLTSEGNLAVIEIAEYSTDKATLNVWMGEKAKSPIDLSTPEATIKSFVKAVYDGNLEAAGACVSKDGADYEEFKEMLATESNHPFQAMIKAMDDSVPIEITSKSIKDGKCKISWYFTLGRVYYFGENEKWEKGRHTEFSSYLELVGNKWLIRDI